MMFPERADWTVFSIRLLQPDGKKKKRFCTELDTTLKRRRQLRQPKPQTGSQASQTESTEAQSGHGR